MPVFLKDVLPVDLLLKHIEDGVVRKQVHPQYHDQLYILNYSEVAQFDRIWDDVTKVCRGLIVATTPEGDIVLARGFNKFHNLNTEYVPESLEANLPRDVSPLATQKLDGSMGVFYRWDHQFWIATRGSFASDQAQWATRWVREHVEKHGNPVWIDGYTPVFEIIYSENRIVVDYDFEGLVLLSLVNNATAREADRALVESFGQFNHVLVVKKFDKTLAECAAENNLNEEGYVLTFSNGVKVKVKFASYVRLHRILTGLNPKSVWEMLSLKQDEAIEVLLSDELMPETFKAWLLGWVTQLRSRYVEIEKEAKTVFAGKPAGSRKDDALYFTKIAKHLTGILFKMLDGRDYAEVIWDMIRPKATDTFKQDGE